MLYEVITDKTITTIPTYALVAESFRQEPVGVGREDVHDLMQDGRAPLPGLARNNFV